MPLTPLNWLINGTGIHIGLVHVGFTQHDSGKTQFVTSGKVAPISARHAALRIPTTVVAKRIATAIIRRKKEYNYTFMGKLPVVLLFFCPRLVEFLFTKEYSRRRAKLHNHLQ